MVHDRTPPEKRLQERTSSSRPVIWSTFGSTDTRVGWMLETSENSCAFAWRGGGLPLIGEIISLTVDDRPNADHGQRGIVKRVQRVHDDLAIIAVVLIDQNTRPKAKAKTGRGTECVPEPKAILEVKGGDIFIAQSGQYRTADIAGLS